MGFSLAGALALALLEAPLALAVAAGLVEGSIVAFAQQRVLRRDLPVRYHQWALATAIPAMLAYGIGDFAFPWLGERQQWVAAALVGVGIAALLGAGQWIVLRRHARRAAWWIPASALAWAMGVGVATLAIVLVPDGAPARGFVVGAAAGGVGMGAVVGVVTGVAYERMLR